MNDPATFEKCLSFIDCHLQNHRGNQHAYRRSHAPAVTVSRQTGAGGLSISEELATYLNARRPASTSPWTVFHKNLVDKVIEDHHLPMRADRFMSEDKPSAITDTVEELLGLHPPSLDLVERTRETVLRLADLGHVILVGRGGHVITSHLDYVFHVRLVGSLEERIKRICKRYDLNRRRAVDFIRTEDAGRSRYLRNYFHEEIENPLLYHLTINTDAFSTQQAAELIGQTLLRWHADE